MQNVVVVVLFVGGGGIFGTRLRRTVVSEPGRLIELQLDVNQHSMAT